MYTIKNEAVVSAIEGTCRTFRALLEFNDGSIISGADVGSATIEHTMTDDNTIAVGRIVSRRAEINLYSSKRVVRGDVFRLYLYILDRDSSGTERTTHRMLSQWTHRELSMLTHSKIAYVGRNKDPDGTALGGCYIPFGEFIVAKSILSGEATVVTAYDRLQFSDKLYVPTIDFPASAGDVADDVLRKLGIPSRFVPDNGAFLCSNEEPFLDCNSEEFLCSEEYAFNISFAPVRKTCREVLSYIAAMYGRNGMLDRNGVYTNFFIGLPFSGDRFDDDRIDVPELADSDISISGVRCIVDDETALSEGDPDGTYAAEFECPYMTEERLSMIWAEFRRRSWRPSQVHVRLADPRQDLGDMKHFQETQYHTPGYWCSIPVTGIMYSFDGGLSADITACGQVEQTDDISEVDIIIVYSSIAEMEKSTIAELEKRTIAELEG